MKKTVTVLVCYDRSDYRTSIVGALQNAEYTVYIADTASASVDRAKQYLNDIDVIIFHKDLGDSLSEKLNAESLLEVIEEAPWIRRLVGSGEYPDGIGTVLDWNADGYFPPDLDKGNGTVGQWLLEQVQKGMVLPTEDGKRGREVAMPLYHPSSSERMFG